MTHDLDQSFNGLQHRTAMYTGENTLRSIEIFLSGYGLAAQFYGRDEERDPFLFPLEFNEWVAYRLRVPATAMGWRRMILEHTDSEPAAIQRFFELLDEFKHREPHVVARLVGINETYRRTTLQKLENKDVMSEVTLPYPDAVRFVTYTDDPGFFVESDTDAEWPGQRLFRSFDEFASRYRVNRDDLWIIDPSWFESNG